VDNLTVEQVEGTNFVRLTYEGTDPYEAARIAGILAEVASEHRVEVASTGSNITATVYEEARVPDGPASPKPLRNGLLTLVVGLALVSVAAIARARRRPPPPTSSRP
jgi:capsular polysaccharide biosynthesis protein